ncbi:hypothetical protein DPMN_119828 [Dreissena polymorpha]|uniref:Uncharacterized protein n=1 Tax=Dreissena polymorpha TaxID=45954 RepID=A0A9D4GJ98_DREPO|nr:hypothetical protein DPMN_119828 [Dreissena polymorpha]
MRSHYIQSPPRLKPVNSPAETQSTLDWLQFIPAEPRLSRVMPRLSPGESWQHPGRAPVYRHSAGTHQGYTSIRPQQNYGNTPV